MRKQTIGRKMTGTSAHLDKAAEEALRDSEGRYRSLLGISLDATAIHIEGRIVLVNAMGAKLLGGVTPEDVIGKLIWEFVHPDFQGIVKARLQQDSVAFVEEKLIRLDGQVIDVQMAVASVRYEGQRARQIIIRDITWRKQAEEKLRESLETRDCLFDATPDGIFVHEGGIILEVNRAGASIYGYEPSEMLGTSVLDYADDESRDLVMQNIRSEVEQPYEAPGVRKDGTKIVVEIRGKAFMYRGRPVRLAILRDVTERKRLEEALQIAREELEDRADSQMNRGNHYNLSFRETAVLNLLASGRSDKEIATLLSIRTRTASKHVENILRKMGAACRTDAGVRAVRESLID